MKLVALMLGKITKENVSGAVKTSYLKQGIKIVVVKNVMNVIGDKMPGIYKKYIVEARTKEGTLDLKNRTPFLTATENQIADYYFFHNPEKNSAKMEEIYQYFNNRGWYIREKTW